MLANVSTDEPQLTQQEIDAYKASLDMLFKHEIDILTDTLNVIQELLLGLKSSIIPSENQRAAQENTLDLQMFLATLKTNLPIYADPNTLDQLQFFNQSAIEHLLKALANNKEFSIDIFDPMTVCKRYTPIDLSLEELFEKFATTVENNSKNLARLKKRSSVAGLTDWNKKYRRFNDKYIQPTLKYNLHGLSALTLVTAFAALCARLEVTWGADQIVEDHEPKNILDSSLDANFVRRWFGYMPRYNTAGNSPINSKQLFMLGHISDHIRNFRSGYMPLLATCIPILIGWNKTLVKPVTKWATKVITHWHNKSMGGFYALKQDQKDGWMVNPRVDFSGVIGNSEGVMEFQSIVSYLENPERFDGSSNAPEKGWLLTGPTRTGKSFLVEALAGEIKKMYERTGKNPENFKFFKVQPEWLNSEGSLKALMVEARSLAPCILFFDEIDLLNLQRTGNTVLLHAFLDAMSGALEADPDKVVIMIAATNSPETMEKALKQPGRLGKRIEFVYPSFTHRKQHLQRKLQGIANLGLFNIEKLAYETEGHSYESLNTIIKRASFTALVRNEPLSQYHLEQSFDKDVRNIIPVDDLELPDDERHIIGLRQAGHALSMILLASKNILSKVITKPYLAELKEVLVWDQYKKNIAPTQKRKYGKVFSYHTKDTRNINSYEERIKECKIALGGRAAEKLLLGNAGNSYDNEQEIYAYEIALALVSDGLNIMQFSDKTKREYEQKALALYRQCEQEVYELLAQNKDTLAMIVDKLVESQELTHEQLTEIMGIAKELPLAQAQQEDKELPIAQQESMESVAIAA